MQVDLIEAYKARVAERAARKAAVAALGVHGFERAPAPTMGVKTTMDYTDTTYNIAKPQHATKAETVKKVKILLEDSAFIFGIPNSSIEGKEIVNLRKSMPPGTTAKCIKNTLMHIAAEGTEWSVVDPLLQKANLWFFVDKDVNIKETLEVVQKWTKDFGKKETHDILGGVLDGTFLDTAGVDAVSKLPSKQELIAKTAFLINEIGSARIARLIKQVPTKLGVPSSSRPKRRTQPSRHWRLVAKRRKRRALRPPRVRGWIRWRRSSWLGSRRLRKLALRWKRCWTLPPSRRKRGPRGPRPMIS
jgi:large subunit ribosomal protein L10